MRKKFYFNGTCLIEGRKFFGKIRGVVVASSNSTIICYPGQKCVIDAETFIEVSKEKVDNLKNCGFVD